MECLAALLDTDIGYVGRFVGGVGCRGSGLQGDKEERLYMSRGWVKGWEFVSTGGLGWIRAVVEVGVGLGDVERRVKLPPS